MVTYQDGFSLIIIMYSFIRVFFGYLPTSLWALHLRVIRQTRRKIAWSALCGHFCGIFGALTRQVNPWRAYAASEPLERLRGKWTLGAITRQVNPWRAYAASEPLAAYAASEPWRAYAASEHTCSSSSSSLENSQWRDVTSSTLRLVSRHFLFLISFLITFDHLLRESAVSAYFLNCIIEEN